MHAHTCAPPPQAFKGLWRVQPAGAAACRLSYSLFVRPQPWLLVGLIENRIQVGPPPPAGACSSGSCLMTDSMGSSCRCAAGILHVALKATRGTPRLLSSPR